jgi:hypothetical protein
MVLPRRRRAVVGLMAHLVHSPLKQEPNSSTQTPDQSSENNNALYAPQNALAAERIFFEVLIEVSQFASCRC